MLAPDTAVLKMIDLLENGETTYKLVTIEKGITVDAKFQIKANSNFKLIFTLQPEEQKKGIDIDYFFQRPFALATNGMAIHVNNSKVVRSSRGLNEDTPCKFEIEVNSFRGDINDTIWKRSKQKAYIKYNRTKFNPYASGLIFDLQTDGIDNGFFNAVALKVGKTDFLFYHESIDADHGYFIVNPNQKIDFEQMEAIVVAVITAYGFLTGFYMLDSIYYFSMKEVGNKKMASFYYENFQSAIHSEKAILDSGNYADIPKESRLLTGKQFEKLVNLLHQDKEYLRSAYLLIEASTLKGCSQASLAAVALETISKKVQEENVRGCIIKDKKTSRGLIYKLNKVLKDHSEVLSKEQLGILTNKLNTINTKPNSHKLTIAFDHLGIELTKEEKDCINSRNLFLHGNLPRNKDTFLSDEELLSILANRLVMLGSMLLLKSVGFNGYVIDRGMTDVIKWRMVHAGQKVEGGNCLRNIGELERG